MPFTARQMGSETGAYGIADRYESYINELKGKLNEDPDNENYKTVYLPEIELAESSCGEMLKTSTWF